MILFAACLIVLAAAGIVLALGVHAMRDARRERREMLRLLSTDRDAGAMERASLLDRMSHLADKPWTPPPGWDMPAHEEEIPGYVRPHQPEELVGVADGEGM
jgi:hypothetical protein